MHNSKQVSRLLLVLAGLTFVVASALAAILPPAPATAQENNLLQNGGFEGNYAPFQGDSTKQMAPNWTPWNIARKQSDPGFVNLTPEYRNSTNPKRIRGGSGAQEFFTFFATHTGGVLQRVSTQAGAKLRFSIFVNVWSTSLDDVNLSEQPGRVRIRAGIDPTGGTNGASQSIVWKEAPELYDQYQEVVVEATAAGNAVTVFVESAPKDPVKNNNVYVDDASLTVTGQGPVVIQPTAAQATTANQPTREGTVAAKTNTPAVVQPIATNTPAPLASPSQPTATQESGSQPVGTMGQLVYTVASGDSLISIATKFGSSVDLIISANGLNADGLIFVGQSLVIPIPPTPTPVPVAVIPTAVPNATATFGTGGASQPTAVAQAPVDTAVLNGPTVNGIGTYIVQKGDTLAKIATRYNITVEALSQLNGIVNPAQVVVGTVLAVPGPGNNPPGGTVAPTVIASAVPAAGAKPATHTVQPGENLFRIALRYNVSVQALMQANGLGNANVVFAGQVLRIP